MKDAEIKSTNDDTILTLEEAASHLRIANSTARALAKRGELPGAFKLGGQWRVTRSALDRYVAAATA